MTTTGRRRLGPPTATLLVSAFVAALVVLPLLRLVEVVLRESGGDLAQLWQAPGLGTAVANTLLVTVVVTAVAVPIGTATALLLRRPDVPGKPFWRVAVLLPVLVPEFVLGYSWTQSYGRAGFTDMVLGQYWPGVLGPVGVVVVLAVNAAPIAYLLVAVGLAARAEPDLERAARASGAGGLTVLRTVTLPLLRSSVAAGAVLVAVLTLGAFAIPQVMGAPAGFDTVTTRIYADLSRGSDPRSFVEAIALALLLVVITAVLVAPADTALGPRLRVRRVTDVAAASVTPLRRWPGRVATAVLGGYLLATVGLPLLALLLAAVTRAVGVPPSPQNWTLANFQGVLDERTIEALGHSLTLALVAATVLTVLGGCVAALEHSRVGRGAGTLLVLTLVLPGSTLAVALLITYGQWLAGSLTLILLAYLAKLWAVAHRPVSGALDRLTPEELHAARASGAGPLTAARTVALPPLAPALLGGWLVCFVTALHEVTMSSLLYGPGSETLAVVVLRTQELGRVGPTAALSVLLTALLLVPALALLPVLRRLRAPRPAAHPAPPIIEGSTVHV